MLGTTLFVNVPSGKSSVFFGCNIAIESFNHFPKGQTSLEVFEGWMHFYYSFTFTFEAPLLLILHSLSSIPSGPRFWRESYKSSCHYYSSRVSNFYSFSMLCDFFLSHSSPVMLFQIFVTFPQFSTGSFHRT